MDSKDSNILLKMIRYLFWQSIDFYKVPHFPKITPFQVICPNILDLDENHSSFIKGQYIL